MKPTHIFAGWLVDGSGEAPKKNVFLRIIDGRIDRIDTDLPCNTNKNI